MSRQEPETGRRRRWYRRVARGMVLYVVVPYVAVTAIFAVFQRKLIYRPTVAESLRTNAVGLEWDAARDVEMRTPDGETLRGWLLHAAREGEGRPPLVVYFPGNSLNRYERRYDLREVAGCGFDVLIFDYRGYGDSTGSPSEEALTADARRVWRYAREELGYEEERIVVFGESLGGAVALSLWSDEDGNCPEPAAVILNATFASLPRVVGWHYPAFPFRFLLLDRWPSAERISAVRAPVVVLHSTGDEMVPPGQGRELAEAAADGRFVEVDGGGHNSVPIHRLREELVRVRESMGESGHGG